MKKLAVLLSILLLALTFTGCGGTNLFEDAADDSSSEAEEFKIQTSLDDGNYEYVITKLSAKSNLTPKEQVYLASAYLGRVNVDFINLIEVADTDLDTFDVIASIFGGDEILADPAGSTSDRAAASLAISVYLTEIENAFNALDDNSADKNVKTMKGVLGALDITLIVAKTVLDVSGADSLTLTEEGITEALNGAVVLTQDVVNNASAENDEAEANARIDRDLTAISGAIDVFTSVKGGDTSDIKEDFEEFLNDLDQEAPEDTYNAADIASYINNVIVGGII